MISTLKFIFILINDRFPPQRFVFLRIQGRYLSTLVNTPGIRSVPQVLGPNETIPWTSHLRLLHNSLYIRGPPLSP